MGINRNSDDEGTLQIGPTDQGMVRLYVSGQGMDLPMDFTPDEAEEIAAELMTAVEIARAGGAGTKPPKTPKKR